jgi:N-acetylneuraminate synthase
MGARIIERHFTWNKEAVGPDHRLSSDPAEMTWLVESIRAFESMRGDGVKRPAESERKTRLNNRKSIVLNRSVQSGQVLQLGDLAIKRPGTGIAPKYLPQLLGRRVNSELAEDELLRWEHLV